MGLGLGIQVLGLGLGLGLDSVGRGLDAIMLYTYVLGLCGMEFVPLGYLFERILAVPASSAPVVRVFF